MDLWYPKDTVMALTAYADADHVGCQDTCRSTSGSARFLGDKLVSWSSKKQTSTSIFSTKAEYIAIAFTASSTIPSIYIQQFWDTVRYVKNTKSYSCQLDEQWFDLNKDTRRDALQITPVDNNNSFSSPPTLDVLINFVNDLGYPKVVRTLSAVMTNDMYQPWRALTMIINLCLTGKTLGFERPKALVLQILWGVVNRAHIDYAERISKGTKREVFGIPILNDLITADIRGGQYYNEYLEKVAKHQRYLADEEGGDLDSPAPKPTKATKPKATKKSKPSAPKAAPVTKPTTAKASKSTSSQQPKPAPTMPQEKKRKLNEPRRTPETTEPTGPSTHHEDEKVTLANVETNTKELLVHTKKSGEEVSNTENLKLTVEEHVILEESASSTGTLSSLQHLAKDFSFGDQFFNNKPSEAKNEKTTIETKAESMVFVTIQQDIYALPPMTTPVIDLTSKPDSPKDHFKDLPEADMKEILHQRMWETNSYQANEDHKNLYNALEKSMTRDQTDQFLTDLAKARRNKKRRHDSLKSPPRSPPHQPPPPPPPAGPSGTSGSSRASGSSQVPLPPPPAPSTNQEAWTTFDTRFKPSVSSIREDLYIDDDSALDKQPLSEEDRPATPEPSWSIPSSDLPVPMNNWASALAFTYVPPSKNSLLAQTGDMAIFMDWYCKKQGITELKQKDLEGLAFEIVRVFHPNVIHLQYPMKECHKLLTDKVDDALIRYNVSKPLPLGGQPGQITIQTDFFFKKDLEYLRYGSKGSRPVLSILKMKAAYYPNVGLEKMVPDQTWIGEEYKYDIAAIIEVLSLYGYDYMKKIVLHRVDLKEYIIAEREFKYLYPSNFEDLYLLNVQGHLNHLPPKDKKTLTTATQLNLTKPRWDATGFEYKHDFIVIESLRAITFRDKYRVQMIMRFNEIHKFSDGTLHQIDEALDYRVKEFKVNRINPGLNTRFWTRKDVDGSKEFMFSIQKRLKTKRIFCNLESFVGERVREGDYRLLQ
nr:putative mitochondrial protein [Tanacetum cinerariifolium]